MRKTDFTWQGQGVSGMPDWLQPYVLQIYKHGGFMVIATPTGVKSVKFGDGVNRSELP